MPSKEFEAKMLAVKKDKLEKLEINSSELIYYLASYVKVNY